jgi:hypothetical protein
MNIKLVSWDNGEWEQLWIDGEMVYENHIVHAEDVLDELKKRGFNVEYETVEDEETI